MKKYLPYIIIFIVLVGLFGSVHHVSAAECSTVVQGSCTQNGKQCTKKLLLLSTNEMGNVNSTIECTDPTTNKTTTTVSGSPGNPVAPTIITGTCSDPTKTTMTTCVAPAVWTPTSTEGPQTAFKEAVDAKECILASWVHGTVGGCIVQASYLLIYQLPAYLLALTAYFFNVMISFTLYSDLLKSPFVSQAWGVVRDLSNMFFILILLYIAVKIILGMAGSDVKKMIAKVVILALLINFSMFFTEVIIDTTNILALVFYNKISVDTKNPDGSTSPRPYATVNGEKDVAGGMVSAFDPTSTLKEPFFVQAAKQYDLNGNPLSNSSSEPPVATLIALIIIAGLVMCFAIYALAVAGLSFLGRLIELWVLIIFSPFAFMSSTVVPLLSGVEDIGWDQWFKDLMKVSFMAPIFMFFLYFIFMLIHADIFSAIVQPTNISDAAGIIRMILGIVLPTMLILILLLKATKKAKEGGGAFGEVVLKGAKMAGGLALGGAMGLAASTAAGAGKRVIGGGGGFVANKAAGLADKMGLKRTANRFRDVGDFARKSSFDVRGIKIAGKSLGSVTGLKMGEAKQGGWNEMKKQQKEKREKRADELVNRGTAKNKKKLDEAKAKLNQAKLPVKADLELVEQQMEKFRRELNDANKSGDVAGIAAATLQLKTAQRKKASIRAGAGLDVLERNVHGAQRELDAETSRIASEYAQSIQGGFNKFLNWTVRLGAYSMAGADEAARNIRMGAKVETKT